jgi:hypothetical protein
VQRLAYWLRFPLFILRECLLRLFFGSRSLGHSA